MLEKENVKQVFGKNKDAYITSTTHANKDDLQKLVEWINPNNTMTALDIATGGGHVAKVLSTQVRTVFSTDITKEMLENTSHYLQDYPNIYFIIADAESLPFLDNSFDIVTCRIAAHHFPNIEAFIKEVHRVLKPSGRFLFIDNIAAEMDEYDCFINKLEKIRDYSHVRSHKISEWKIMFDKYDMQLLREVQRRKTLPFHEWVHRTLDSIEEIETVTQFLEQASEEIQDYFEITWNTNGNITSFTIDEWMVLSEKHALPN